jgi:hypothetical protein
MIRVLAKIGVLRRMIREMASSGHEGRLMPSERYIAVEVILFLLGNLLKRIKIYQK